MAILQAGGNYNVDMRAIDARSLYYGTVVVADSQMLAINLRGNHNFNFIGNGFTYDNGRVIGGTVTMLAETDGPNPIYQLYGISVSASSVYSSFVTDNVSSLRASLFYGDDQAYGSTFADYFNLYNGNDIARGGAGTDVIDAGSGNDIVYGNQDADFLNGQEGSDTLYGGQGIDTIEASGDSDLVYGNLGNDILYGNGGNDTLFGGQGDDLISELHQADDDVLCGNQGNDTLIGGRGADQYVFAPGSGADRVEGFDGSEGDRILLAPGTAYSLSAVADHEALMTLSTGDTINITGYFINNKFNASHVLYY